MIMDNYYIPKVCCISPLALKYILFDCTSWPKLHLSVCRLAWHRIKLKKFHSHWFSIIPSRGFFNFASRFEIYPSWLNLMTGCLGCLASWKFHSNWSTDHQIIRSLNRNQILPIKNWFNLSSGMQLCLRPCFLSNFAFSSNRFFHRMYSWPSAPIPWTNFRMYAWANGMNYILWIFFS